MLDTANELDDLLDRLNELDDWLLRELERLLEEEDSEEFGVELGRLAKLDVSPTIELCDELDEREALDGVDDILLEDEPGIENEDELENDELDRILLTEEA